MEYFVLLIVAVFLAIFWIYQFTQLMLFSDSDFPGRYDKALWVAAFILACIPAPFAFYFWKRAYIELRNVEQHASDKK
jgi:hypothetical protein